MAESVACKSNKTKKAPQSSGALFLLNREEAYFFFFVVVLVFALVVVDAAGVVLAVVSIFMPVSIAAGAGAIAGAEVSAVEAYSFFEVADRKRAVASSAQSVHFDIHVM